MNCPILGCSIIGLHTHDPLVFKSISCQYSCPEWRDAYEAGAKEVRDNLKDIHIVPEFEGEPTHAETERCWCTPELHYQDEFTDIKVWTHRRPE